MLLYISLSWSFRKPCLYYPMHTLLLTITVTPMHSYCIIIHHCHRKYILPWPMKQTMHTCLQSSCFTATNKPIPTSAQYNTIHPNTHNHTSPPQLLLIHHSKAITTSTQHNSTTWPSSTHPWGEYPPVPGRSIGDPGYALPWWPPAGKERGHDSSSASI